MKVLIVTRHEAARRFAREAIRRFVDPDATFDETDHLADGDADGYDAVAGVLPVRLIWKLNRAAKRVFLVSLPMLPPEKRGRELSYDEMVGYGAQLVRVVVSEYKPLGDRS